MSEEMNTQIILDSRLEKGLNKLRIRELTDIQKDCLTPGVEGKNIIACSPTGTGKTFAYLLPVIQANHKDTVTKELYAVILAPSKELSIQICSQINQLSNQSGIPITAAALFGGVNKQRQLNTLKSKPNIVVGTYGRIYELIKERRLPAHQVKTLIIDEADQLCKEEHMDGILALRKCFMRDIQVMMFSASIKSNVEKASADLSIYPFVNIFTKDKISIPSNIKHFYFVTDRRDRIEEVRKVIKASGTHHCMIFVNSKYDAEEITQKLEFHQYKVAGLTANLNSNTRRQIVDQFHKGQLECIICSDMAARGMHFDHVDCVINVGLSEKSVDYLHRAGRCGRDGSEAYVYSIVTEQELPKIKSIQKTFSLNFIAKKLYQGKIVRG